MNPIEYEELSALLDGELSREREAAVRRDLEADPALRDEYARLANIDERLRALAAMPTFVPYIEIPKWSVRRLRILGVCAVAGLTLARLTPKYLNSVSIGVAVNCLVLVMLLSFVVWAVRDEVARTAA
jgi:anti-sigma factor RsiW